MGVRTITVYGTVMGTRLEHNTVVHHVEATAPGGDHLDLMVLSRRMHRGAVRVKWDPDGHVQPCFPFQVPWSSMGVAVGIVAVIVVIGWLVFG